MFNRSSAAARPGRDPKKEEAEAKRLEALKKTVKDAVEMLRRFAEMGDTDKCVAAHKRLGEMLKNRKLPAPFSKDCRFIGDALIRDGLIKAADAAAQEAVHAAFADDSELRGKKIKRAREVLALAMQHRAPASLKQECEKLIETAMLSGGIRQTGPTKAKPLDTAPKPPNRAKPEAEAASLRR
ncbi:MAG: hypothetical protein OHK0024_29320 [Thalassobaculales bacterium]